jgi:hypothetical protein
MIVPTKSGTIYSAVEMYAYVARSVFLKTQTMNQGEKSLKAQGQTSAEIQDADNSHNLHAIAQHLHQLQQRAMRFEVQQGVIMDRIPDLEAMYPTIGGRMSEEFERVYDERLAAIETRDHSPNTSNTRPIVAAFSTTGQASNAGTVKRERGQEALEEFESYPPAVLRRVDGYI